MIAGKKEKSHGQPSILHNSRAVQQTILTNNAVRKNNFFLEAKAVRPALDESLIRTMSAQPLVMYMGAVEIDQSVLVGRQHNGSLLYPIVKSW
jgi:hypothetical protein